MFETIIENVYEKNPLVHAITNYVTVNDCANILLACGASPIMADDKNEVEEITSLCNALVINIGTLNERTVEAMVKAGVRANELSHVTVLDPVGAGASRLRTATALELLNKINFSVIRGNISEIKTVASRVAWRAMERSGMTSGSGSTKGVDANVSDIITEENLDEAVNFVKALSKRTGSVIAVTGKTDIVADSERAFIIRNGHELMSKITGTGCMLTTVIAAYCAANHERMLEATAAAVCAMGLCGELAYDKLLKNDAGTSSYRMYLIDYMSKMNFENLQGGMKIESR